MSSGEVSGRGQIIRDSVNQKEMLDKLEKQHQRDLERVLAKRKAETVSELEDLAGKAIVKRQLRTSSDHKSLKDHTIIVEAKSDEIIALKQKLNKEITDLAQQVLKDQSLKPLLPSLAKKLTGRVKPGGGGDSSIQG